MNTHASELPRARSGRLIWQTLQAVVLAVGTAIVMLLLLLPKMGLYLLWDVLIPVAPLLLAVAPGVWRNVCPLGTFSLAPRHLGLSRASRLNADWQGRLLAGAVLLLVLIVPLRHVILDYNGVATGVVLLAVAALAAGLGALADWKSAWCSGLCPVHPVELLYGSRPLLTVDNSHCRTCTQCTNPCRDARDGIDPVTATRSREGRVAGWLLVGGFPGFVWGWFQVPAQGETALGAYLAQAYLWPIAAAAATLVVFAAVYAMAPALRRRSIAVWAAAAISAYYWFKLPVMLGLEGSHPLVDVSHLLPAWAVWPARILPVLFFLWLLVLRRGHAGHWASRPSKV